VSIAIVRSPAEARALAQSWRREDLCVGLVPTMGALHEGHLSLVARSRAECSRTVVSIFVNPLQFGPTDDYARYPRRLEDDAHLLEAAGVDAILAPSPEAMYPPGSATRVTVSGIGEVLEGVLRPGHFEGVATVVTKLFNAVRPDRAYFGRKDAQQAALVTRVAGDLDTGVRIVVCPIVREPDGLALSSRNAYLDSAQRAAATCLFRALGAANEEFHKGEHDPERLSRVMGEVLAAEPLARSDYAEVVDELTFRPPGRLAVLAVRIGDTRLIDNHRLGEPLSARPDAPPNAAR
jgi:pantoate--beta-alanine ligase